MAQTSFEKQLQRNRDAYLAMRQQLQKEYAGQYVALADGQIVGTGHTYDAALASIQRLDPRPEHFIVFEAEQEPVFDVIDDFQG